VLVVVGLVDRVPVLSVQIIDVVDMSHGVMTTFGLVDVHVSAVSEVLLAQRFITVGQVFDMVVTWPVDLSVVEEVEMVLVRHVRVATPTVVLVGMAFERCIVGVGSGRAWQSGIHAQDSTRAGRPSSQRANVSRY